jgi:hypothetical protein
METYRNPLDLNPADLAHQSPGILAQLARQVPLSGFVAGTVTTGKKLSFIAERHMTLRRVRMKVGTTGSGGSTVPDVNINGVTALAAGGVTDLTVANTDSDGTAVSTTDLDPANQVLAPGDVLSFDIDTAPTAGADIDVAVAADIHI